MSGNTGVADDLFGASAVAHQCRTVHRVLRWRQAPPDSVFAHLHALTHPHTHVSSGAAHAMWADLPHDLVQLQSNGGETGTVFGRDRNDEPISPARLASLWLGPAFATEQRYLDIFEEYADHSAFRAATMLGYNHHDLNYWEHRMGKWGYLKFGDGDLSHRVLAPFNDRGLLETMLSVPEERRVDKYLYRRTLEDHPRVRLSDS